MAEHDDEREDDEVEEKTSPPEPPEDDGLAMEEEFKAAAAGFDPTEAADATADRGRVRPLEERRENVKARGIAKGEALKERLRQRSEPADSSPSRVEPRPVAETGIDWSGSEPSVTRSEPTSGMGGESLKLAADALLRAAQAIQEASEKFSGREGPKAADEFPEEFTVEGPKDSRTIPEEGSTPGTIKEEWEESLIGRFQEFQIASQETQDKIIDLLGEILGDVEDFNRRLGEITGAFERRIR